MPVLNTRKEKTIVVSMPVIRHSGLINRCSQITSWNSMLVDSVCLCWPWVCSVFLEVTFVKLPLNFCNVGYFQITFGLFFKASPGAHPFT